MPSTHDLLHQRYGHAVDLGPTPALNPVLETILSHRSVRGFLEDELPAGTLAVLSAAAQSAASSSNLQVWSAVAVENRERKDRLALLAGNQAHVREAPLFFAFLADLSRLAGIATRAGVEAAGLHYLDTFLMAAIDAALAAQNVVTAAESLGLGTVYIGALRNRPEEVARALALEPGVFPLFGLCVGKPDPSRPTAVKPRLPQRAVIFREQYAGHETAPEIAHYDAIMASFYASQQLDNPRWSVHSTERVRSAENLRGRDRLKAALQEAGFALR